MDKRTILALVLVAIVIILTPKLFPSANPKSRPVTNTVTTKGAANSSQPLPAPAKTNASVGDSGGGAKQTGSTAAPSATIAAAPNAVITAHPESTTIQSAAASYRFTNLGAALVDVRLLGYQALDKSGGTVTLTTKSSPLLQLRVLTPTDTIGLRDVPFAVERTPSQGGAAEVLTYRASVKGHPIAVKYTVVADSFLMHVEGTVGTDSLGGAPSFVLIDLPQTIHSFEADSLDDQNHLAFAIKPTTRAAEGIPFRKLDPGEKKVFTGPIAWAAAKSKYFIVGILAPEGDQNLAEVQTIGGPRTGRTATIATGTVVARLNNGVFRFDLYAGPQKAERLKALGRDFENSNPYGGWLQGIVQPFAALVLKVLLWIIELLPLAVFCEMMRVYKEHDMSPFSTFAGCLPLLLPMPVLFALFFVFQNTIEFRGVPFLWLTDISLKDPFYIIPLLMGGSMFILSWVGMRNAPPNPQAKMMQYVFPVMMTFHFANFASGLNLYYAIQNFAAIPQQWLIANERGKAGGGGKAKKG
jgi:YidC/Oxa1 family membrane protein insertase